MTNLLLDPATLTIKIFRTDSQYYELAIRKVVRYYTNWELKLFRIQQGSTISHIPFVDCYSIVWHQHLLFYYLMDRIGMSLVSEYETTISFWIVLPNWRTMILQNSCDIVSMDRTNLSDATCKYRYIWKCNRYQWLPNLIALCSSCKLRMCWC